LQEQRNQHRQQLSRCARNGESNKSRTGRQHQECQQQQGLKVADVSNSISNSSVDRSSRDNMKHLDSNIDLGYSLNSRTIRKTKTAEILATAESSAILKFRMEIYKKNL
jgi:hypothetical protein